MILTINEAVQLLESLMSERLGTSIQVCIAEVAVEFARKLRTIIAEVDGSYRNLPENKIARIKLLRELCGKDKSNGFIGLGPAKYIIENWDAWTRKSLELGRFAPTSYGDWQPNW